jgi:hypothetical protein
MTKNATNAYARLDPTGIEVVSSGIRPFRLGDYGLLELSAPLSVRAVQRALLWEWSTSPAGVIMRVSRREPLEDEALGAITAVAAALVRMWPGTPIGLISDSPGVRDLARRHPDGHHLVIATTLTEVWDGLWSRGGKGNVMVELPPTGAAPGTARDVVARACRDWHLDALAAPASLLTGDLVTRSVLEGAQEIHFTVSRHGSRVRLLARDDVPSTAADELRTTGAAFDLQPQTLGSSGLAYAGGELAFEGHHVRWAVADVGAADVASGSA